MPNSRDRILRSGDRVAFVIIQFKPRSTSQSPVTYIGKELFGV
ncbi:hypothetical protein [Leptothermofonsia sp. ETS-13]